jgi:hypothetical protein
MRLTLLERQLSILWKPNEISTHIMVSSDGQGYKQTKKSWIELNAPSRESPSHRDQKRNKI